MKDLATHNPPPIGQKLKFEMKKRGISSAELAKRADVKTSFIYDVLSGKSANPSTVKLARVVDCLGISLAYLVDTGEGSVAQYPNVSNYVSIPRLAVELSGTTPSIASTPSDNEPVIFHKAWISDHLRANSATLRVMSVRGDSMEPSFQNNDTVLVDTAQKSPSSPGFFVIFDGLGLAVKRLEYVASPKAPRVKILSDNPQYSDYERSVEETTILGRIIWFSREL